MDNYIKAIEDRALARCCFPVCNANAALKLKLEDEILKFEKLRNQFLHDQLAAAAQHPTVVPVMQLPPTVVLVVPLSSSVAPLTTPLHSCSHAVNHCHRYDGHCNRFDEHLRRYYTSSPKVPTVYFSINTCVIQIVDKYIFCVFVLSE